ncbi:MAG: polysaccharide pyruvyl transferase [Phycisphaerales bacterium]|nr:polysaccharide pyruvyl transferase [Phycisphaerales bacterium]
MDRRTFLRSAFGAALAAAALPAAGQAARPPRILLRNAWQSVNIGDIAHPVGVLTLLERYVPEAEVRLWPSEVGNGAGELLAKRFPKLVILKGPDAIATAIKECDLFLHGSSSGFAAVADVARWRRDSGGKPYGVYGISFLDAKPPAVELLSGAKFAFFRETVSLKKAQDAGCTCPVMGYGPDSAFGVTDLRNDPAAAAFLAAHGLEDGKFMCCIPRYRWTPYWSIKKGRPFDEKKHARNQAMKEHDHAPLRDAIAAVVRQAGMKVLVCPEDMTQVALGKGVLVDPLPADVKAKVVWRDTYWLTDEAVSTYVRSAGLFGNEMHSPIMCVANGVPAVVCRFDEQTVKGYMWRDVGLNDWLFDLDDAAAVARIPETVLAIAKDPAAAKAKVASAQAIVRRRQQETMAVLKQNLPA